ncbi:hypothetical protein [Cupriavidus necator]
MQANQDTPFDKNTPRSRQRRHPGWYEGRITHIRTTHIHMKAIQGTRAVLTSQFFLPDALSEYLYTQLPAYRRRRTRDTLNSTDGIALKAGDTVVGAVRQLADRYVADLILVVDQAASPVIDRPPVPGEGPPPGGRGPRPGDGAPGATLRGAARVAAIVPGRGKR